MIMMHAIGFKATGLNKQGEVYDCSFVVTFPAQYRPSHNEIQRVEQSALVQFHTMHPTGKIEARVEKSFMASGVNTHA